MGLPLSILEEPLNFKKEMPISLRYTLILLLFSPFCFSQDRIMTEVGEIMHVKIESIDAYKIVFSRNNHLETLPALTVRWVEQGDSTIAFYPEILKGEVIQLSSSELHSAIREKKYGLLLHSFTLLEDVLFDTGKTTLTTTSRENLLPIVNLLAVETGYFLQIKAHTDNSGTASANYYISQRRAASVQQYFFEKGISTGRIEALGMGFKEPLFHEKDQQVKNRRIELRIPNIRKVQTVYAKDWGESESVKEPEPIKVHATAEKTKDVAEVSPFPDMLSSKKVRTKTKSNLPLFTFSIGVRAGEILEGRTPNNWTHNEGVGLSRHYGGDLQLNFRLKKSLGVILKAGYLQSSVHKNYQTNGIPQYQSTETLTQIPLQTGVRLYLLKVVYLQANGGVQLLKMKYKENEPDHPDKYSVRDDATCVSYGGSTGLEFNIGKSLLDVSAYYENILTNDFYTPASSLPTVGVRLGLGLNFK